MQELNETPEFTRYNIERTLGSGGMGTVYLAHHNILNRSVALKVPNRELAQNEIFVERFLREARALGTLNHPHIVTVYDAGIEQNIPYIAMEYVAGDTLANCILDAGQIDITLTISWGLQMARALAYLHNQQILHRDLKSANVIIDHAGNAVIADFGIAQIDQDSDLTTGMLGTPSYISPEQAKGASLDARSDLYSLGVILYECLTGRLPFRDENSFALIQKVIHEAPQDIWNHRPDAPLWLCDLINKCLEKNLERRFQDGTELASALQQGLPDNSPLMRSEPADTIVSHIAKEEVTVVDQHRSYALANLANSFRQPAARLTNLLPYVDPSPTVTMFGPSQIIQPVKRESRIKAAAKPVSASMMLAFLAVLLFIPINQLPPQSARGQLSTSEVAFPVEEPGLNPMDRAGMASSINRNLLPPPSIPDSGATVALSLQNPLDSLTVAESVISSGSRAAPELPTPVDPLEKNGSVDSTGARVSDISIPADEHSGTDKAALPVSDVNTPEISSPEVELLANNKRSTSGHGNAYNLDVDSLLLEDQREAEAALAQMEFSDIRLPQSIATLADLDNRTELVRTLAAYQAKKVLLFGTRSNVKEPDLAFVFLINKENKKIRGILAPSPEGWTDIYSGKIVTEEKGRFYEREPSSEVTLKWWLHDVTPIWVELNHKEQLVARPLPSRDKKKRMGW